MVPARRTIVICAVALASMPASPSCTKRKPAVAGCDAAAADSAGGDAGGPPADVSAAEGTERPGTPEFPAITLEREIKLLGRIVSAEPIENPQNVSPFVALLGDELRETIRMRPPAALRFPDLPLPEGATLAFGLGVWIALEMEAPDVTVSVRVTAGDSTIEFFRRTVPVARGQTSGWDDIEVEIPAIPDGGGRGAITFEASGGNDSTRVEWSWPTVRSEGRQSTEDRSIVKIEDVVRDLVAEFDTAVPVPGADGILPRRVEGRSPAAEGTINILLLPAGGGARFRVGDARGEAVRYRFHVMRTDERAGGRVRLTLRYRDRGAGPAATARTLVDERVELGRVHPGFVWMRTIEGDADLAAWSPGGGEIEVMAETKGSIEGALAGLTRLDLVRRRTVLRRPAGGGGVNVVLIVVDAMRRDHVGAYGYARATTPNLDAAAAEGWVFDQAVAAGPATLPSVPSLLTGTYPWDHGAVAPLSEDLAHDAVTLAETMRDAGWTTAAFVTNPFLAAANGYAQGFETYDEGYIEDAERVTERIVQWIRDHRAERFFVYAHYMEPHAPYAAPEPFYNRFDPDYAGSVDHNVGSIPGERWESIRREGWARPLHDAWMENLDIEFVEGLGEAATREGDVVRAGEALRRRLIDLYDAEVWFWDRSFGRLRAALADLGLHDETIVIVTADHGEAFGERRRLGHGVDLGDVVLRVPLVAVGPGFDPPRRIARQVSLIDLVPIILDRAGIPIPGGAAGMTLDRIEGPEGADRFVFALSRWESPAGNSAAIRHSAAVAARTARGKVVYDFINDSWTAYDLMVDAAEERPQAATGERWTPYRAVLAPIIQRVRGGELLGRSAHLTVVNEMLRALGYLR